MAFENNTPTLHGEMVDAAREISERRAATISRMVDEAAKHGLDDEFAYDAVADYGIENAKEFRKTMKNPDSFKEFANSFGTDHNRQIYEMNTVEKSGDKLVIEFHYCPYVKKWNEQGKTEEEISRLCDIAMAGDHSFADQFPGLTFTLDGTIAKGQSVCRLCFDRVAALGEHAEQVGEESRDRG